MVQPSVPWPVLRYSCGTRAPITGVPSAPWPGAAGSRMRTRPGRRPSVRDRDHSCRFRGGAATATVESGTFGHATDADTVVEAGQPPPLSALRRDMVRVGAIARVGDGRSVYILKRYTAAHARLRPAPAIAAERDHESGLGDVLVESELDTAHPRTSRQARGDSWPVAGLVTRQAQRADQAIDVGQAAFGLEMPARSAPRTHAVLGQDLDVLRRGIQLLCGVRNNWSCPGRGLRIRCRILCAQLVQQSRLYSDKCAPCAPC
ncbi:hypothetical protein FQR65_LT20558 [Abscondita terminalis]|nr:hypothetical protein FQR65_LT20558 [Abscondita terminalis]